VTFGVGEHSWLPASCLRQQDGQLVARIEAIDPRLGHLELGHVCFGHDVQCQSPTRLGHTPDFPHRRHRIFPEIDDIRRKHPMEAVVRIGKSVGIPDLQLDAAGPDGSGVPPGRLLQHGWREIDTGDPAL